MFSQQHMFYAFLSQIFPNERQSFIICFFVIRMEGAIWSEPMLRSSPECDIRENLYTNECPNIFVSTKLHEWISEYIHINFFDTNECPNKYSYWKLHEYSNIFEYSSRFYTLTHSPTNVRIYSYKQIWHERMSEYIRKRKIDTNECPNIYSWPIYSNIRIYSSHPGSDPPQRMLMLDWVQSAKSTRKHLKIERAAQTLVWKWRQIGSTD